MSDSQSTATIVANGNIYSAWTNVMVRRDYGNAISTFEFSLVEGAYGTNYSQLKLKPGDSVQIYLAGQLALTGAVTTRTVAYDAKTHQVVIAGRSLTAEAKESSIKMQQGNFNGYSLTQAAQAVLAPHNINFTSQNDDGAASKPFQFLAVQYGETPAEFIGRMAMARGLFLSDDVNGNLVASRRPSSSSSSATFVEGQNIQSATATMDNQGVAGQFQGIQQTPGTDQNWPSRAYSATATNSSAPASRLNLFIAEHPMDADDLKDRVDHEAAVSNWSIFKCTVTALGWTNDGGQIWDPDSMSASVNSPMLFPTESSELLLGIQGVTSRFDNETGRTSTLEMTLPWLLSEAASSGAGSAPAANTPFTNTDAAATPDQPDYQVTST